MRRWVTVGICAFAVLIGIVALTLPKHLRLAELSSAELGKVQRAPQPPEDSCPKAQRVLEDSAEPASLQQPLTADEAAIYAALLDGWNDTNTSLNLSRKTIPLYQNISDCDCLKDIDLESLTRATRSFRILPRGISSRRLRLVDAESQLAKVRDSDPEKSMRAGKAVNAAVTDAFSNGLFQLSEIAFDKTGQKAIVSYSFVCGQLCGSGSVLRFEKVDGIWKLTQRNCGGWVS